MEVATAKIVCATEASGLSEPASKCSSIFLCNHLLVAVTNKGMVHLYTRVKQRNLCSGDVIACVCVYVCVFPFM